MQPQQKIILETERLFLYEFSPAEAPYMYELNLDPEVLRYTGDKPFPSVESARRFLEQYDAYEKHGYGRWSVWLKMENAYLGWCGLKYNEEGLTDLGFRFFRNRWNQGFATEAAKASIAYGFERLQLTQIIGRADRANLASLRVLEKVGMNYWKTEAVAGIEDAVYYRITNAIL